MCIFHLSSLFLSRAEGWGKGEFDFTVGPESMGFGVTLLGFESCISTIGHGRLRTSLFFSGL